MPEQRLDLAAEILRLRQRSHDLNTTVQGLVHLQQHTVDQLAKLEGQVAKVAANVGALDREAEVQRRSRQLVLSAGQKLIVSLVTVATIANTLLVIFGRGQG